MTELIFLGPVLFALVLVWGIRQIGLANAEHRDELNDWCRRIGERVEREMNAPHHSHIEAYQQAQYARAMQSNANNYYAGLAQQQASMWGAQNMMGQCGANPYGYQRNSGFLGMADVLFR